MLVFCIIISMMQFYDDSSDEYDHKKKIVKSLNKDHYLEGWPWHNKAIVIHKKSLHKNLLNKGFRYGTD